MGHFELTDQEYAQAWEAVVCGWLPESGYEPEDRSCYELFPVADCEGPGPHPVDICFPVRPM